MSFDPEKIRQIIITLNLLNKDRRALPIDPISIKKYGDGLHFISTSLFRIITIYRDKTISKTDKINLIRKIRDPDNKPFINKRLATWIYEKTPSLRKLYKKSANNLSEKDLSGKDLQGGSKITEIGEIIISPLKLAEDRFGTIITVPLEITTLLVGTLGTISQLISSTVEMLPFPPPLGWVPEIVGDLMLGVHVFSNGFNIFLNIGRANWDIVIQSAMGTFPQFLEISNGLTMQLIGVNRVLVMITQASSTLITETDTILPILKPIISNPLPYLNPYKLSKYVFNSIYKHKKTL